LKQSSSLFRRPTLRATTRCVIVWCCALFLCCFEGIREQVSFASACSAQEVSFRPPDEAHSISINATDGTTWDEGGFKVVQLTGTVEVRQGSLRSISRDAVLFIDTATDAEVTERKVIVYLEGGVRMQLPQSELGAGDRAATGSEITSPIQRLEDERWLGRLFTASEIEFSCPLRPIPADGNSELYLRARNALLQENSSAIQQVQYQQSAPGTQVLVSPLTGQVQTIPPPQSNEPAPAYEPQAQELQRPQLSGQTPLPGEQAQGANPPRSGNTTSLANSGPTRVDITARDSTVDFNIKIQSNPENTAERVWLGAGGCRVTISSPEIANLGGTEVDRGSQVVILADNVVAWQTTMPDGDPRWELYLEGNVVFSKGTRVIYCERLYYSANDQRGTILNADMLTPIEGYRGLVRLKADVIQQTDANNMQAIGAAFTSSRMGVPRYWLQSATIDLDRRQSEMLDPTSGAPLVDPYTGQPQVKDDYFVDSRNNYVYVADTPVFYWPRFQASLEDPNLYLERLRFGNDRIFGYQVYTGWDLYQLLNFREKPENSRWIGTVDYLSERGLALGTERDYASDGFFGLPGTATGMSRSWFLRDEGLDTLGRDRRDLFPEKTRRGRLLAQHR